MGLPWPVGRERVARRIERETGGVGGGRVRHRNRKRPYLDGLRKTSSSTSSFMFSRATCNFGRWLLVELEAVKF